MNQPLSQHLFPGLAVGREKVLGTRLLMNIRFVHKVQNKLVVVCTEYSA